MKINFSVINWNSDVGVESAPPLPPRLNRALEYAGINRVKKEPVCKWNIGATLELQLITN